MKYIQALVLPIVLLASCNLLDIQPVNRMVPVSVADYESLLLGGYPRVDFFTRTELCTDNVYANLNAINAPAAINEPWFVWAATHLLAGAEDAYWNQLYSSIYYANSVLDEFDGRVPEPEERVLFETVRGEARALRAYCYFYLANLYADTPEEENLDKPGVPMPLSAEDVHQNTQNNTRVPVGKVWERINIDLDAAERDLAGKTSKSLYRFDYTSLQALRARVALFERRYDDAIAAASDVIAARPLFDMNTMQGYLDEQGDRYAFSGNTGFIDLGYKNEVL
ncbi:MAG: RagB/SusD family nutrient uptake outer membrane protein, partial [Odoribacteraceae bacterium]|nr:RagB/SusD family nutrient uptake outer membrane protein [Odoribacteraceae bacterium]